VKIGSRRRQLTVGKADFSVPAGQARVLTLKVGKAVRKAIRRNPAARKVVVRVKVGDTVGNKGQTARVVRLTGPGSR